MKNVKLNLDARCSQERVNLDEDEFIDWLEECDIVESYHRVKKKNLFLLNLEGGQELSIKNGEFNIQANVSLDDVESLTEKLDEIMTHYLNLLNTEEDKVEYDALVGIRGDIEMGEKEIDQIMGELTKPKEGIKNFRRVGFDYEYDFEKFEGNVYRVQITKSQDLNLHVSATVNLILHRDEDENDTEEKTLGDVLKAVKEVQTEVKETVIE